MTLHWHPDAVQPKLMKTIRELVRQPWMRDFYLAGGTGLSLQLGHRLSMDIDLFSATNRLRLSERTVIAESLRSSVPTRVQEERDGTLHALIRESPVSFLRYDYPMLNPLQVWEGVPVASVEDIAMMKMGAVVGRGARKDFIDLYAITRRHSLRRLLELARKKFPDSQDFTMQALKALVYFEDAEKDPMPRLLAPLSWPAIVRFFEREVPQTARALIGK